MNQNNIVLPGEAQALWIGTTPGTSHTPLSGEIHVDVAVVGGGIVGLTTALLLKNSGARVAVLESNRIAKGVSGHTTAKITSSHGMIYGKLSRHHGEEKAWQYASANQQAIQFISDQVKKNQVACDFTPACSYIYSPLEEDRKEIENEFKAASRLSLPVRYTESETVPFQYKGGIRYDNQAYFHPRKYLLALAEQIPGNGSHIFEQSRVIDVTAGKPCQVKTDRGIVKADQVIIATHFPILDRGMYFAKMVPRRSYVMAFTVKGDVFDGMYYSIAPPFHTVRKHVEESGRTVLLAGGEDHPTGQVNNTLVRYLRLEAFIRKHFDVQSILYRWSTQDNDPFDQVPFVGRHSFSSRNIFVATGFKGWGMTNGTAAAMILSDMVSGRSNPFGSVFSPVRTRPYRRMQFATRNAKIAGMFIKDNLLSRHSTSAADLKPGQAEIISQQSGKAAVFKDYKEKLHAVSPHCTHMYCTLEWNNAEKSWDCPCHGSRFDMDGKVLHAPAVKDLKKK